MKKSLFVILFCLFNLSAFAQKKDWGIGLRLGEPSGVSVKKFFGKSNALDVSLGSLGYFHGHYAYRDGHFKRGGFAVMANYLWQKPIKSAKGLDWYAGVGGQLSSRRYYYDKKGYHDYYESNVALGATGVLGLEYFIPNTPISLFADVDLYAELLPSPFFVKLQAGLGGRFNF